MQQDEIFWPTAIVSYHVGMPLIKSSDIAIQQRHSPPAHGR